MPSSVAWASASSLKLVLALGDLEGGLHRIRPLEAAGEGAEPLQRQPPLLQLLVGQPGVEERRRLVAGAGEAVGDPGEGGGGAAEVLGAEGGGADREELLVVLVGELEVEPGGRRLLGRELMSLLGGLGRRLGGRRGAVRPPGRRGRWAARRPRAASPAGWRRRPRRRRAGRRAGEGRVGASGASGAGSSGALRAAPPAWRGRRRSWTLLLEARNHRARHREPAASARATAARSAAASAWCSARAAASRAASGAPAGRGPRRARPRPAARPAPPRRAAAPRRPTGRA